MEFFTIRADNVIYLTLIAAFSQLLNHTNIYGSKRTNSPIWTVNWKLENLKKKLTKKDLDRFWDIAQIPLNDSNFQKKFTHIWRHWSIKICLICSILSLLTMNRLYHHLFLLIQPTKIKNRATMTWQIHIEVRRWKSVKMTTYLSTVVNSYLIKE